MTRNAEGVLEETLIAFRVPSFKPCRSQRRVSQQDRFVFFDLGVRNALLGIHQSVLTPSEKGRLFKQWFLLQCLFYIRAHKKSWSVSSFRTDTGLEVDVVIDLGSKILAIECKPGTHVSEGRFSGFRALAEMSRKPVSKFLVYHG